MSASKTNLWQEITLALKEMLKTCTSLSKKMVQLDQNQAKTKTKLESLELQIEELEHQKKMMITQLSQLAQIQGEIANQVVTQHEETQALMKGLGLKKDLSYYSFNLHQEEGH